MVDNDEAMVYKGFLGHGEKKLLDRVANDITVKNEVSKVYFSGSVPLNKYLLRNNNVTEELKK
jgi:hypothetical protein